MKVTDLVAGYIPGVNILNGCSIEARKGELIGIIGPNGAGKSTLLKAMFGLVKVHSGSVVVRGQDITGLKANKLVSRGVGFVPQNNNVFAALTIEENLQMGMFQRPKDFAERFDFVTEPVPGARQTARPARRLALRRRTPDGRHGTGPHDGPGRAAARRALRGPLPCQAG